MKKRTKLFLLPALCAMLSIHIAQSATPMTEWAKSFGGVDFDQPTATATDANGNLFIATKFDATCDFDPDPVFTELLTPSSGLNSVAITKYDSDGNLLWIKVFSANEPSSGSVYCSSLIVDKQGNVYFGGDFSATTDFNPSSTVVFNLTPEAVNPKTIATLPDGTSYIVPGTYDALFDGYVCKLDNDGNFVWAKQFNGDLNQEVLRLFVDDSFNVFVSIISSGSKGIQADFNPDPNEKYILKNSKSNESQFITKLDANGKFVWVKHIEGTDDRYCYGLGTDKNGNIYMSGHFMGTIYPNPENTTISMTSSALHDLFLIKFDAAGKYIWSKCFGGVGYDVLGTMDIDKKSGNIYLTGQFSDKVDFNRNNGDSKILTSDGVDWDGFVAKYDGSGYCLWAKRIGGIGADNIGTVSIDGIGNLYVGGFFENKANFDAGYSNYSMTSAGQYDAFVMKLDTLGNFKWAKQIGGLGNDWTSGVTATIDGNVFAAGAFSFDAGIGFTGEPLTAVDGYDVWMFKSGNTTDIKNTKIDTNISIYPNPTQGRTVIDMSKEFSDICVTVRNLIGTEISNTIYYNTSKINLNLEGESGIYFIDLKDRNGKVKTLKVLKI